MKKFGKRVSKSLELTVGFFGSKALVVGSIPVIYWLLRRPRGDKTVGDIGLLVASYAIVGGAVLIWKFIKANSILRDEERFASHIAALSGEEQYTLAAFAMRTMYRGDLIDEI